MTTEETIWQYLVNSGMTKAGASGMMGNMYHESLLNSRNLETIYESKLKFTDDSYTKAVDSGVYSGFGSDWAGYGLCQWTYPDRKKKLLAYARNLNVSIGDLNMQLSFLINELKESYQKVWSTLIATNDVKTASDTVMVSFENPRDKSDTAKNKRYLKSYSYYEKYKNFPGSKNLKTNEEIAYEVLDGKWGNGNARKINLVSAGYDYSAVQAIVNKIVSEEVVQIINGSIPNAISNNDDKESIKMICKEIKDGEWGEDYESEIESAIASRLSKMSKAQLTYTVESGDTLTYIAKRFNTTIDKIVYDNLETYPELTKDLVRVGWVLKV